MRNRLKLIKWQMVTLICIALSTPLNVSYESNAVESESSVSYVQKYSRGFEYESTYKGFINLVTITPIPIVKEKVKKKTKHHKKKNTKKHSYTKEDLRLLAGIIQNEAGSKFCNNRMQRDIASVVLNRVKSKYFPNTIRKVIFQKNPKQYDVRLNRFNHPSKRAIKNAKYVLEHGSTLPDSCIFQSEFRQGDFVYKVYKTKISTTYICYKN